ncbi:phosphoribosylformylglycinamidine synthase [Candidatus Palibaumannia cicadellinicola]|uniref:Phosphoribosylformylglycinamidine synthase n=1 Tax=Candidatus Palibaumannia cicadellinicola TaxID=186490 RepID=A0A0K2BJN6_9GAMM|nr:phosphoribosylformylglycinamidine synthase [Candidatus Baumannia cicadellinicola]AKZ65631.1 Phosphoribosylformylglycinamidine synthase, synthetase subunit [Candidatus Baumannia cicadellinicola]
MEIFRGLPAMSVFRINKLLSCCKTMNLPVNYIDTEYIYFAEINPKLTNNENKNLIKILKCISYNNDIKYQNSRLMLVTPRYGTISPWSSKAQDILHNCGLKQVKRIERGIAFWINAPKINNTQWKQLGELLHDRMIHTVLDNFEQAPLLLSKNSLESFNMIDILSLGRDALEEANISLGLALTKQLIQYLFDTLTSMKRNISDVELYMFAQANSEHCRHNIFNAKWLINGKPQNKSLFNMIKSTFTKNPDYVLSAYKDNAAVIEGPVVGRFFYDTQIERYDYHQEAVNIVIKVETHNHPTAISPWPGAATGIGGEIRDEGATGIGAKPKAGLVGFTVSNLRIPGFIQPWEGNFLRPDHIFSALEIMTDAPLGGASFNNEFGRPLIIGYFRTYEELVNSHNGIELRGYYKPIMLAGGIGNIRNEHVHKNTIKRYANLIVLGGPAMNIGLGGSTASSIASGQSDTYLDFASVQRDNPEMERRCQEVIDRCCQLGKYNPILFIHDVGAGGLSNALLELIRDLKCGGSFNLRAIPNDEPSMSPLKIWCNEAQERYVIALLPENLAQFEAICRRERAPFACIGTTTKKLHVILHDDHFRTNVVDLPLEFFFGKVPNMIRDVVSLQAVGQELNRQHIILAEAVQRVLHLPVVAEKTFLITIADRSVTGMVARDQMVGPWQVPVADCAITLASFDSYYGEVMSIGERAPVALLNFTASARLAVGEAITNLAATNIGDIKLVKLSANWMAAAGHPGEDAGLYAAVKNISEEVCPALGLTIIVGKDSMSMKTSWQNGTTNKLCEMTAPLSLVITAVAKVEDVRATVTPQLRVNCDNLLILINLGSGHQALGATALAQVYRQLGDDTADIRNIEELASFYRSIQKLVTTGYLLAYHDRSDGGLLVTLAEMAFAGHCGIDVDIAVLGEDYLSALFNEELGAIIQIAISDLNAVLKIFEDENIAKCIYILGSSKIGDNFIIRHGGNYLYSESRTLLRTWWAETSWQMQRLRDNPECADQEHIARQDKSDPGLNVKLSFNLNEDIAAPYIAKGIPPKVAILREQGINSNVEMAAAFHRAGFHAIDVHMSDLISGVINLKNFHMLVACGGFSYGDVLGSGEGWAKSILFNSYVRDEFEAFFYRPNTLALGVCNGCQMMSHLRELIPGVELWPHFIRNKSESFESRFSLVEVTYSPSILLQDMVGSRLPIVISHGEGRVNFNNDEHLIAIEKMRLVALRYIDNYGRVTEKYPANPNGSVNGITAITSINGQVTLIMPHPERIFRTVSNSWHPDEWGEDSPWMRLFRNARKQIG